MHYLIAMMMTMVVLVTSQDGITPNDFYVCDKECLSNEIDTNHHTIRQLRIEMDKLNLQHQHDAECIEYYTALNQCKDRAFQTFIDGWNAWGSGKTTLQRALDYECNLLARQHYHLSC